MKAITYKVSDKSGDTEVTSYVPATHSDAAHLDKAGVAIAAGLLMLTLAFVGGLVLAVLR